MLLEINEGEVMQKGLLLTSYDRRMSKQTLSCLKLDGVYVAAIITCSGY